MWLSSHMCRYNIVLCFSIFIWTQWEKMSHPEESTILIMIVRNAFRKKIFGKESRKNLMKNITVVVVVAGFLFVKFLRRICRVERKWKWVKFDELTLWSIRKIISAILLTYCENSKCEMRVVDKDISQRMTKLPENGKHNLLEYGCQ